jgi:hypothetical protein
MNRPPHANVVCVCVVVSFVSFVSVHDDGLRSKIQRHFGTQSEQVASKTLEDIKSRTLRFKRDGGSNIEVNCSHISIEIKIETQQMY